MLKIVKNILNNTRYKHVEEPFLLHVQVRLHNNFIITLITTSSCTKRPLGKSPIRIENGRKRKMEKIITGEQE